MTTSSNETEQNLIVPTLLSSCQFVMPPERHGENMNAERPKLKNYHNDVAKSSPQIVLEAVELLQGWPKVVCGSLLVPCSFLGLKPLSSPASLFAYISGIADIDWKRGSSFVAKDEFFQRMLHQCEQFKSVATFPHYPPLPDVLYHHPDLPVVDPGRLDQFINFFSPATIEDRSLIRALACTLFWGGTRGARPLFVITNRSGNRSDTGRGIGKTTLITKLSELCGGFMDADSYGDIGKLYTRLLSAEGQSQRIVRWDNVKSDRFSCAGLERLITTTTISGHHMYKGEGRRPNDLLFAMTMNGVNLSDDLASRSVVIELSTPTHSQTWNDDVDEFIKQFHFPIIAEIIDILKNTSPVELRGLGRFAEWEGQVLARQPHAQSALELTHARRGDINGDAETVRIIVDEIRNRCQCDGRVPSHLSMNSMIDILATATGTTYSRNQVKKFVERLAVAGLSHHRGRRGAYFEWLDPNPEHISRT